MLLSIDIFSKNKGRGYENPSLEIIVIECCWIGGCPLEEAREHYFMNQSSISIVVLISFLCYCGDHAGYITVILPFLAFYFYCAYLLYLLSCKNTLDDSISFNSSCVFILNLNTVFDLCNVHFISFQLLYDLFLLICNLSDR
jgi:hypothetical protein